MTTPPNSAGAKLIAAMAALPPGWIEHAAPGSVAYVEMMLAAAQAGAALDQYRRDERLSGANTVCVVTRDSEGRMVVLMQSLFHWFGSGVMAAGTGMLLQNRGAGFSLQQGASNRLSCQARPPHTLAPVFVQGPSIELGLGIAGGPAQPQLLQQVLVSSLDCGLDLEAAVSLPRWFQGKVDAGGLGLHHEAGAVDGIDALSAAGHRLAIAAPRSWYMGQAQYVASIDGALSAGTDPRGHGSAMIA